MSGSSENSEILTYISPDLMETNVKSRNCPYDIVSTKLQCYITRMQLSTILCPTQICSLENSRMVISSISHNMQCNLITTGH